MRATGTPTIRSKFVPGFQQQAERPMSTRSLFLQRHLDAYALDFDEKWRPEHQDAMNCRNVEDCVAFGLFLLERIRHANASWAERMQASPDRFAWETAEEFGSYYRDWQQRSRKVLQCIARCERRGFQVEKADEFRHACQEVALLPLDVQEVREAVEALDQGRGIPFTSVANALRDRVR